LRATALPTFLEQVKPIRTQGASSLRKRAWTNILFADCRRAFDAATKSDRFFKTNMPDAEKDTACEVSVKTEAICSTAISPAASFEIFAKAEFTRLAISDHVHDVRSEPYGLLWLPCAHGNRGGVCELGSMVDRCVSSLRLRIFKAQRDSHHK
jgi:hypothetical protein